MKLLITSPTYPPFNSGLGNAVQQQAFYLGKLGISVTIATEGAKRNSRHDATTSATVEEFDVEICRSFSNPIAGIGKSYIDFLLSSKFDVILMNGWQNWATDLLIENLDAVRGRKYLYSHCISTNLYFHQQPVRSLARYLAWRPYWRKMPTMMAKMDGIIVLDEEGSDSRFDDLWLAKKHNIPVTIIPNCLTTEGMSSLRKSSNSFDARSFIISVGAYQWQKGFDFVLKAYAKSNAKNRIQLRFFGQNVTPYVKVLKKLERQFQISEGAVVYSENISGSELLSQYENALLFLSGSHTECQPLVLLDSISAGTPFVARNTGCIERIQGGAIVNTVDKASRRINELLGNSGEWERLSSEGRKAAQNKYHPEVIIPKLYRLITNESE